MSKRILVVEDQRQSNFLAGGEKPAEAVRTGYVRF